MASATPQLIINEALCFIIRKQGRIPSKQLKSLLFDFYKADILATAKDVLLEAVTALNIDGVPKTSSRIRRNSKENTDAKMKCDIDDLIALLTFMDENNHVGKLPTFVAADPDLLPSVRLLEGDMLAILNKLAKHDERFNTIDRELSGLRGMIGAGGERGRGKAGGDGGGGAWMRGGAGAVGRGAGGATVIKSSINTADGSLDFPALINADRETITESDCTSARESEDDFERRETRNDRRNKKRRATTSPQQTPPYVAALLRSAASAAAAAPTIAVTDYSDAAKRPSKATPMLNRHPLVIGQSSSCALKAAQRINLPKSVYRVGNVNAQYSADDLKGYIESIGVRVVSCFDRTSSLALNSDNKTFRVCILDMDKNIFLRDDNWTVGISIQKWLFKPKSDNHDVVATNRTVVDSAAAANNRENTMRIDDSILIVNDVFRRKSVWV